MTEGEGTTYFPHVIIAGKMDDWTSNQLFIILVLLHLQGRAQEFERGVASI